MPEFNLRPYKERDLGGGRAEILNDIAEARARALAAAVIKEAIAATIGPDPDGDWAETTKAYNDGIETAIDIIHRLVPPLPPTS